MDNLLRNLLVAGNIVHASFDEMKSIFVNKFTGQTCYLRPEMWYGNFIENFWYARNEVKRLAKIGVC